MKTETDKKQLRLFGLALSAAILFWLLVYCWITKTDLLSPWPVWLAIIFLADFALFKPEWLSGVFKIWMQFVNILNLFITYSLLGSIFILLVTPIAWVRRLFGHNALSNKDFLPDSYRVKSRPSQPSDMEHPY